MCGLIGIINAGALAYSSQSQSYNRYSFFPEEDILNDLFILSSLRGQDSTGLFAVHPDEKQPVVYKKVISPSDFIETAKYKTFNNKYINRGCAIIGHTRKATIGGHVIDAAHPHQGDRITLVHNGTLDLWKTLPKGGIPLTDSHAIMMLLEESEGKYKEVLSSLQGSFAVIFYDNVDKTIYFARNNERPLSYLQYEDMFIFASEYHFATLALQRNFNVSSKEVKYGEIKENRLYSLNLNEMLMYYDDYSPVKKSLSFLPKNENHKNNKKWNNNTSYYNNQNLSINFDDIKKQFKDAYGFDDSPIGETIFLNPLSFSTYSKNNGKDKKGNIYFLIETEKGEPMEEFGAVAFYVQDPASLNNCDYLTAKVKGISRNNVGTDTYAYFPQAKYRVLLESDSLKGYVYDRDDNNKANSLRIVQ